MNKGQNIITCPNCGGNRVQRLPITAVMLTSAGCMLWIPIIGWIMFPFFLIASIFTAMIKGKGFKCQDCKHGFRVSKEAYKEYVNIIKQNGKNAPLN